jgi:hypothetical protein
MSANKSNKSDELELTGRVERKPYGESSKSAHNAVYLITDDESYILRQRGANAFNNPVLEKLVGKTIRATGKIRENIFFLEDWIVEE